MKVIKRLFYFIVFVMIACCLGILVCALNPDLTDSLAAKVQQFSDAGEENSTGVQPEGNTNAGAVNQPGLRADWVPDGTGGYVAPDKNPKNPPEEVSGRNGYRPVEEEAEQVPQEEADNLSSILATGDLGEELSFSEEYYPYYAMLEENMKLLYKQIYANASALTTSFTPVVTVDVNSLRTVFEAVCNDHPELFWLDTGYSCKYLKNGTCVEIILKYNDTANRLDAAKEKFNSCAESILAGARALGSSYDQEMYVHNALMRLTEYDEGAELNQSAYSALVNGRSVCAGYARAFQYLMQQLGIPCYYCTGYAGEDHAWNIVKLGVGYRNVDVTWDDTDPSTQNYLNKTDEELASTHVRTGLSVYLPACTGSGGQASNAGTEETVTGTPLPTPMSWVSRGRLDGTTTGDNGDSVAGTDKQEAGVTDEEIVSTLEEYYEDCKKQLKAAGTGDIQFNNVIPETLWSAVEKAYASGTYRTGYVNDVLKELGVENFAIQLQAQRLGGGYYRIYHNIYTY